MSARAPILADRTALVDGYVTELSLLVKEGSPDAVIDVLLTRYEDEDASGPPRQRFACVRTQLSRTPSPSEGGLV